MALSVSTSPELSTLKFSDQGTLILSSSETRRGNSAINNYDIFQIFPTQALSNARVSVDSYGGFWSRTYINATPDWSGGTPLYISAISGQTGDLTKWSNSAGTTLARVASNGVMKANVGLVAENSTLANYTALQVNSTITNGTGIVVQGASGQTANLQEWQNNGGTVLASINYIGQISTVYGAYTGSASFGGVSWNGISNPAGVTTLPSLVVKSITSQTANLQEWQDSAGTVMAKVTSGGSFTSYNTNFFGRTFFLQDGSTNASTQASGAYFAASSANSAIYARTTSASIIPLVVQGTTSQTADLQQWQDSTGNKLAKIIPNGSLVFGNGSTGSGFTTIHFDQVTTSTNTPDGITWNFVTTNTKSAQILAVRTAASYATDLYFATANPADQNASEKMRIGSTGTVTINGFTSSNVGLIIKAAASQTADLQQWQNSAGTVLTRIASDGSIYRGATTIDYYGAIYTTETMAIGASNTQRFASGGMTIINREFASSVIFGVKGIASQTGDLTQWRNSSDTILAKVDANGNFSAISKSFDIPHPTKENMRLRYASLEGPENGVYIRGTAESNIIELPEYWTELVHEDSITVSLTAVGSAQNIYVEKIENNKVYIGGELTKAFFTVYGERKDIDKLTVEY